MWRGKRRGGTLIKKSNQLGGSTQGETTTDNRGVLEKATEGTGLEINWGRRAKVGGGGGKSKGI